MSDEYGSDFITIVDEDGTEYELEVLSTLEYNGQTYTETHTDFDFFARDTQYMYVGMFANRGTVVEFSDVVFEITGESQGA